MTLELNKIADQVASMGESAAKRQSERDSLLPTLRELLNKHASHAAVHKKVKAAIAAGWRGMMPTSEPPDLALDALVATDGSQIYPDQHSLALYYVINIGSIVLRLGTEHILFIGEACPANGIEVLAGKTPSRREQKPIVSVARSMTDCVSRCAH